jgi:hypothetical protein
MATMGPDHMIWGIGESEREAIQNALEHIGGLRGAVVGRSRWKNHQTTAHVPRIQT